MKSELSLFAALFIIMLLAISSLPGGAAAVTATTEPLPFSGGMNAISGTVTDSNGNGIPDAKVTLYYTVWIGNDYKAKDPVRIDGVTNPQTTGDGKVLPPGAYVFSNIPSGVYTLTAEKGGVSVSKNIMAPGGATVENLAITGYIENYSTPTPQPTKNPTGWPTAVPSGSPGTDIGAALFDVLKVLLMGIIGVQLVVSIVVIAIQITRRK